MADETRTILIDVEVEDKDFDQEIGKVNQALKSNREEIKELSKDYDNNSSAIAKLEAKNRDLSQSKRSLIKESKTEAGSLNELRLQLANQTKERNELNKSSVEGAARFEELQTSIAGLNEEIGGFEEAGGDFRRNVGNYPTLADKASAGIKGLWNTLLANPLILLVGLLAGLVKVFSESQAGAEFFRKSSAALNASLGLLKDIVEFLGVELVKLFENPKQSLIDFGELIKQNFINRFEGLLELIPKLGKAITLLFEGEFAEAGKVAFDAVAKVTLGVEDFSESIAAGVSNVIEFTKQIVVAAETAGALESQMIANEKALADLRVSEAQSILSQKELNLVIEDQTRSFEDRIKAAEDFQAVEAAQIAESIRLQEERLEILKAQNDITNSTEEDLQRVRDAEIELANLQAASFERELTNSNKLFGIRQQQATQLQNQTNQQLANTKKLADAQAKANAQEEKEEKALLKLKQDSDKAAVDSLITSLGASSKLTKAVALTEIGLDTARAISGLTAASEANPANAVTFGGAGIAQFIAGIARIGVNIASAKKLIKGGGGGSSIGGGSSGFGSTAFIGSSSLTSQLSTPAQNQADQTQSIIQGLSSMPPSTVSVVDINEGQNNRAVKVAESSLV